MKHLAYLFAFLVLLTSVSATCYNQDNSPFCSKDDPLCEQSGDLDSDNDGWSDSCDAFADNEYLWVDYDGDNIGYGSDVYDCDDLDESILTYCGNTQLLNQEDNEDDEDNQTETEDEETSETFESLNSSSSTTSTSTSTRKGRSHHGNIIYVSDPNDNFQQQENLAGDITGEEVDDVFPETEIIPLVQPVVIAEEESSSNQITGAVTGTDNGYQVWPLFLLLLAAIIMFIVARKKKSA